MHLKNDLYQYLIASLPELKTTAVLLSNVSVERIPTILLYITV